ncbi:MAG: integrase arm-type DNA-binding domain-containing protein [Burkholderiaceae bacterium]|nr:integrase arm-type DNA-binding domain-containing protein [Burkholderiaceae bacterium]
MPLTDTAIRRARPAEKPVRLFDGGGLYLEISPAGGKLWRFKYRFGGKEKRLALGAYPVVPLSGHRDEASGAWIEGAREMRDEARRLLAQGIDPARSRKEMKSEARPVSTRTRPADDKPVKAGKPGKPDIPVRTATWGSRIPGRREQRELKEEVLYETAARWFNEHGYHGTSLSNLAKELGITKAALYNYVTSKRELLYNVHLRSLQAARAARDDAAVESTGLGKVRRMIFNYVAAIAASPTVTFILLEDGALAPEQAEEILAQRRALDHELRDWIAEGVADGSILPCDPRLASLLITGGLAWVTKWYDPKGGWSGERVAEAISTLYAEMLAGRGNAAGPTTDMLRLR